ncbi:TlpA disulfide reductase family protein [Mucilaginibacter sp.]|uniref:TlpA family protein disulfide reductase n=1 Tax=Mucilaginibacter sp. TaxID=1882438 RepID=UPI0025F0B61B|nr:TlpA disulfide reductase family protein [Mucilaginibacter sp.]
MTIKRLLVLLSLSVFILKVDAQKIEIALHASDTLAIQNPSRPFNDTSLFTNVPYKKYPYWSLRRIAYYNLQATYENLPETPGRKKLFREFVERYELDTTYLTKTKTPGNYIYLFNAIDSLGNRHVIVDANNNHDFKDDIDFEFSAKSNKPRVCNATISYYDENVIRKAVVPLKIDAFNNFSSDDSKIGDAKKLDIIIDVLLINKTGTLTVNNKRFKINVIGYDQLHPKSTYEINIQKLPFDAKNNNGYRYKSSDTLKIEENRYTIKSAVNNTLVINYDGKSSKTDGETGMFAPGIISRDIKINAPFSLEQRKGKYVLLDFWGSWCVPCVRLIPEVKKLYGKYKDEIQFVSVAYDNLRDVEKVKKIINEHDMNWVQLFDNRNISNGIVGQYKVNEFPTSILIDPTGKVIYRGTGDDGLKRLIIFYNAKTAN